RRAPAVILLLQLGEEPDVLDGNHRLVGEGLKERDLVVDEPAALATGHRNGSDGLVVTEQWHRNPASIATGTGVGTHNFGHSGIGLGVGDIDRRSIANSLSMPYRGLQRTWE